MVFNDFVDYISRKFNVIEHEDGTFSIITPNGTYRLEHESFRREGQRPDIFPRDPFDSKRDRDIFNIGKDDKEPNFDPRIHQDGEPEGMFPLLGEERKPMYRFDPTHPGRNKNFPEPDNDKYTSDNSFSDFEK